VEDQAQERAVRVVPMVTAQVQAAESRASQVHKEDTDQVLILSRQREVTEDTAVDHQAQASQVRDLADIVVMVVEDQAVERCVIVLVLGLID